MNSLIDYCSRQAGAFRERKFEFLSRADLSNLEFALDGSSELRVGDSRREYCPRPTADQRGERFVVGGRTC